MSETSTQSSKITEIEKDLEQLKEQRSNFSPKTDRYFIISEQIKGLVSELTQLTGDDYEVLLQRYQ